MKGQERRPREVRREGGQAGRTVKYPPFIERVSGNRRTYEYRGGIAYGWRHGNFPIPPTGYTRTKQALRGGVVVLLP